MLESFNNVMAFLGLPAYQGNIPGLGIIAMVVVTILVGVFAKNYFGNKLFQLGDWTVTKIPLISKIYIAIRQLFEALFAEKREVFKHVVLFEYPRPGIHSIGFVTQDTRGEIQEKLETDVYSIFLPTTPNPTSGYLLFIPKKDVILLNITVEDALKLIVSGGAITPGSMSKKEISFEELFALKGRRWKKKPKSVIEPGLSEDQ